MMVDPLISLHDRAILVANRRTGLVSGCGSVGGLVSWYPWLGARRSLQSNFVLPYFDLNISYCRSKEKGDKNRESIMYKKTSSRPHELSAVATRSLFPQRTPWRGAAKI